MRSCLTIAVILVATLAAAPQTAIKRQNDIERVQEVARLLLAKPVRAVVLLNDLTDVGGFVVRLEQDFFHLGTDKKARAGRKIRYSDVLAISSKEGSVSLIPDEKASPYGDWMDLAKLSPNTLIEVTGKSGEIRAGRFRSSGANHLVLADNDKNDEQMLQRADVAYVHRVRYGVRDISGSMSTGVGKGEKIGKEVGKSAGQVRGPISGQPMGDGRGSAGSAMGAGIGAIVGAAKGATNKTSTLKVLLYSP